MDWTKFLNDFTVPIVVLVAVATMLVKSGRWVAKELVLPIRDQLIERVVQSFDRLDETMKEALELSRMNKAAILEVVESCKRLEIRHEVATVRGPRSYPPRQKDSGSPP